MTSTTGPGPTLLGNSAMRPLLRYGPEKHRWLKNIFGHQAASEPSSNCEYVELLKSGSEILETMFDIKTIGHISLYIVHHWLS